MKITITCIELISPFHFFKLSFLALHISNQLKTSNCKGFKKKGIGRKHYTMTLWESEDDMRAFAYSKAHMDAIKESKSVAKEIRTITIDAHDFLDWKEAEYLLMDEGKSYFNDAQ